MNPPLDDLPPGSHVLYGYVSADGEKWYVDGQEWTPPAGLQLEGPAAP